MLMGAVNIWLMGGGHRSFDIHLIAVGVGYAFGESLILVPLIVLRRNPTVGYVAAAIVNILLAVGSANIGVHRSQAETADPSNAAHVRVLVSSQSSDGVTQADMSQPFLENIETDTVERIRKKTEEYLASTGNVGIKVNLRSQANYIESNGVKLAVIRMATQSEFNQVMILGIVGNELKRVLCTIEIDQSVAVSYGECGSAINKTFGVNLDVSG